jgi:Eco57I restriction-modification methylase
MDKARRDNLRRVIGEARGLVKKSLEQQLARYGLFPDAPQQQWEDLALPIDQAPQYGRLLEAVRREARAVGTEGHVTPEAVGRFIREAGGTWVNRLAALRALEARGLLVPAAVSVSDDYGGLSPRAANLRERAAEEGRSMAKDDVLRAGIEDACRELSAEVRVLFDLGDEPSLLWPGSVPLREILRLFASDLTEEDWRQPDILGWVYQYYNTEANAELKRRKNRTQGFKYTADDIPIANQFYTPHWVVRVLTDNTLGRLWLESLDGHPELEEMPAPPGQGADAPAWRLIERRTGVPHAAHDQEAFKAWIAEDPDPLADRKIDRLCRFLVPLPSRPPPRARKRARDLKVLDPACGSGHFLLYAFDLLFAMYREDEPDLDPRAIPALILANNLHGIDIDLRAAQLAAFSLYLKARVTLAAIDPAAKLEIGRLNIVVADAHLGDDPRKEAFLAKYHGELEVQSLYRKILADVDHTNLLGSLLKVRTEFEALFTRVRGARPAKSSETKKPWLKNQPELFSTAPQREIAEVFTSFSGREWTLAELLADLRRFEEEVAPQQDVGAKLFYTDLQRTVGLLGLLSQRYDVVLMNPPYGDMPDGARNYLRGDKKTTTPAHYPQTHHDLATAFMEQGIDLLADGGLVGALVPRSFMYLSSFHTMRESLLTDDAYPVFVQEYGLGILDGATVRTAGAILRRASGKLAEQQSGVFHRLSYYPTVEKPERLLTTLPRFALRGANSEDDWYVARLRSLSDVPGMPYAYWASDSLRAMFRRFPPLDRDQKGVLVHGRPDAKMSQVCVGIQTSDDPRFLRFWWEVGKSVAAPNGWVPFVKGGSSVHFYTRVDLVLNWANDGNELKTWIDGYRRLHPGQYLRNLEYMFRVGVTWPPASWRIRRFGTVGEGYMFGHKGCAIFPSALSEGQLLGLLNSGVGCAAMLVQTPERMWEVGMVGALPIPATAARSSDLQPTVVALTTLVRRARHEGDETCRDFVAPDLLRDLRARLQIPRLDLAGLLEGWRAAREAHHTEEARLVEALDTIVEDLYELSDSDRKLVRRELARRPHAEGGRAEARDDEAETASESEGLEASVESVDEDDVPDDGTHSRPLLTRDVARDLVTRWLSYCLKVTIESDDDGIVPVAATHGAPALILRLRASLEKDLGKVAAEELEAQAPAYLGTADLAEWLAVSREETVEVGGKAKKVPVGFFPWHVNLYRNRPIFWLVSSEGFEKGKTRLTFRAYVHYLRLTPDTLPRLVSHYLDPVVDSVDEDTRRARDAEAAAEGKAKKAAADAAQEWTNTLAALKAFRAALQTVIQGPATAERVSEKAKWLPRTIAAVRGGQDVGHGYQPNIDCGVRVNIAPLVEKKLLPRVVLKRLGGA